MDRFYIVQEESGLAALGETLNSTLASLRQIMGPQPFNAAFYCVAREHMENITAREADRIIESELKGMH